jgi:hypothetical protein
VHEVVVSDDEVASAKQTPSLCVLEHIQSSGTCFMLALLSDPYRNHEKYSLTVVLGWLFRIASIFAGTSVRHCGCSDEPRIPSQYVPGNLADFG